MARREGVKKKGREQPNSKQGGWRGKTFILEDNSIQDSYHGQREAGEADGREGSKAGLRGKKEKS